MLARVPILGQPTAAMRDQTQRRDVAGARMGRARFQVLRPFKMDNDAQLNPAQVAEAL